MTKTKTLSVWNQTSFLGITNPYYRTMGACGELDSTTENKLIKTRPWKLSQKFVTISSIPNKNLFKPGTILYSLVLLIVHFAFGKKSKHVKKKLDRHFMMTVCHLREKHSTFDDPEVRECPYSTHLCE